MMALRFVLYVLMLFIILDSTVFWPRGIQVVLHCQHFPQESDSQACGPHSGCFPSPVSLFSPLFYQSDRGPSFLSTWAVVAELPGFASSLDPSRSWLPIVEAPGCLGHPTSTSQGSC